MLHEAPRFDRSALLDYFLRAATPRKDWRVGMELERMGRDAETGRAIPYEGEGPSVRAVLECLQQRRGGEPILEASSPIGIDAPWGTVSLEPGGQVEWSSRPAADLDELDRGLRSHAEAMAACGEALGVRWLDAAVDPELPLDAMPWMPKARYAIMRSFLGRRGRLAHRMMTQTASIQCAFDFADERDWRRKFRAAAVLSPIATALFANSPRIDGADTGWASYRRRIWAETDPDRCGLPPRTFDDGFGLEAWLDWVLDVPTMFVHRARGRVPAGGIPFGRLLERTGCDALRFEDWETHISTVFTEVRSYTYIEVRSADVQPDELALAVPAFWTGILYDGDALDAALELGRPIDGIDAWTAAMEAAGRRGLRADWKGRPLSAAAADAVGAALRSLRRGAPCAGAGAGAAALERLIERHGLEVAA